MPWFVLRLYALKDRLLSREIPTFASGGRKSRPRRRLRAGALLAFMGVFLLAGRPAHAGLDVDKIVQTFAELAFSIVGALMKAIVLMIDVLIPIMTYNNFVGNPVVKAGWAIVRDTVNMFFVVVLIIIAFGTIFGHKRFQWSQQVPRLLIWAIVINFSKTLCGIMIDFGQVIMLTFANALREVAAGNFIQLLGLNKTYQISQSSTAIKNISADPAASTLQAFDFFAAGIISVAMTMFVLSTLIILAAILLFRIIMLWILVVMAPLAWFVKGAEGVIESNAYKDWWSEFKCLVGVGPILTFFLWLTLTVAGAGSIAVNSGFDVSTGTNAADFTSKGLEPTNFLSFLIGAAMLIAGWKAAAQFCSGVSGQFLGKAAGAAKALTKGALIGAPVAASALALKGTAKGTMLGARGLAATPAALASVGRRLPYSAKVSRAVGSARESVKTGIWKGVEGLGRKTGIRTLEQAGIAGKGKAKTQAGLARMEGVNKATEKLKGQDRETNLNLMKQYAKNVASGGKLSSNEEAEYLALMDMTMGDSRMQKAARADGTLQQAWSQMGSQFERMNAHDSAKTDQIHDFKKSNAGITNSVHLIKTMDDVRGLSNDDLGNEDVQARMRQVRSNVRDKEGNWLNSYDAVAAGHAGLDKQELLAGGAGAKFDHMADDELKRVDVETLVAGASGDTLQRAIEAAMIAGNSGRAKEIISEISNRYQEEQNPKKKMDMLMAMDNAVGMLSGSKADDAKGILKHLNTARSTAEDLAPPPTPVLVEGASGEDYAKGMKHATENRKAATVGALSRQEEAAKQERTDALSQQKAIGGKASVKAEIQALTDSLEEVSSSIDQGLQKKTQDLGVQLEEAQNKLKAITALPGFQQSKLERRGVEQEVASLQKQHDEAKAKSEWREPLQKETNDIGAQLEKAKKEFATVSSNPAAPQAWKDEAQQKLNTVQAQYDAAKAKSDHPSASAQFADDEQVKKIRLEIETKTQQLGAGLSPEEIAAFKEATERAAVLKKHIEEIGKAREQLAKESGTA